MRKIPSYNDWKTIAEKSLKDKKVDDLTLTTYEDIKIKALYTRDDVKFEPSLPGVAPYTRFINYTGYKIKSWYISQEIPFNSPEEFNSKAKINLTKGQNAIKLYIKSNGNPIIDNLKKMQIAFEGLDFEKYPVNIDACEYNLSVLSLFITYLKKSNSDFSKIRGGIDFNPVGLLFKNGYLPYSLDFSFDMIKNIVEKFDNNDKYYLLAPSGEIFNNAGSNSVQEIAFSMATAIEYIRLLLKKGVHIDIIAKTIRLTLIADSDFFLTIAKFRSARIIWKNIIKAFGGNSESQKLNLYVKTTKTNKSPFDVYVNILRLTTEALSAVLGGANSIELAMFDETLEKQNEFSERLSGNIQNVLAEECNLRDTIDPAGGSYFIESLTNTLSDESWKLLQKVESHGGIIKAGENNFINNEISKINKERYSKLNSGRQTILGVNKYPNIYEKEDFTYTQKLLQKYDRTNIVKGNFDKINAANIDQVINAFLNGATISEIEFSFQNFAKPNIKVRELPIFWSVKNFLRLRFASKQYRNRYNHFPQIFVVAFGKPRDYIQSFEFASDKLHIAGFETIFNSSFENIAIAIDEFKKSNAKALLICSSYEIYEEILNKITEKIKAIDGKIQILVAIKNQSDMKRFPEAEVDFYLYPEMDFLKFLNLLQKNMDFYSNDIWSEV